MLRRVALVVAATILVALTIACGFGSDAPRIGDKGDYCSHPGSIKADNSGKWQCEPDDPSSSDTTSHWVKVG
jgi:hypothetical protein